MTVITCLSAGSRNYNQRVDGEGETIAAGENETYGTQMGPVGAKYMLESFLFFFFPFFF